LALETFSPEAMGWTVVPSAGAASQVKGAPAEIAFLSSSMKPHNISRLPFGASLPLEQTKGNGRLLYHLIKFYKHMAQRDMRLNMGFRLDLKGISILWDRVRTPEGFSAFIDRLPLNPPFIVKPNWICEEYAHHTDPEVLKWLLRKIAPRGQTLVVEAYSARNHPITRHSLPKGEELRSLRDSDQAFLRRQGLESVFKELDVRYVNIDEEVLANRTVDPDRIRKATESLFPPVRREELYSFVPSCLYDLRDGTMISLAKFKLTLSMSTKNLFGLIPDLASPGGRGDYHGKGDRDLPRNIIDINKIYRANFNVVGMVEGIRSLTGHIDRGEFHSMFGYDYEVHENTGLLYFGGDPLWLDAFICAHCGLDPKRYTTSSLRRSHLALGFKELSPWPPELTHAAKEIGSPLPVP